MANARKCDRCGLCFDPWSQGEALMGRFQNPVFQNEASLRECKVAKRLVDNSPDAWIDLCPGCTTDFMIFMSNKTVEGGSNEP